MTTIWREDSIEDLEAVVGNVLSELDDRPLVLDLFPKHESCDFVQTLSGHLIFAQSPSSHSITEFWTSLWQENFTEVIVLKVR